MGLSSFKVVIGLGKTGMSCVEFLHKQGDHVVVMDTRENPPGLTELRACFPSVMVKLGEFDQALLDRATDVIVSPGISLAEPAIAEQIAKGKPVYGDIELFCRSVKAPIVAITGSNGKSTVTSLVGEMAKAAGLRVRVGGNLGTPALELISAVEPEFYVLELSSFQLEATESLRAFCAVSLNVSPDHMDRYESFHAYVQAKQRIYRNCRHAVINLDDELSHQGVKLPKNTMSFGFNHGDFYLQKNSGDLFLAAGDELLLPTSELSIAGRHQYANALAAMAIGSVMGLPRTAMLQTLTNFEGLPHRCQQVASKDGVVWYNDSKATNVGAACAALMGIASELTGKVILLAGGLNKKSDFSPLRPLAQRYVRTVILFGRDRGEIADALQDAVPIIEVERLDEAVREASTIAQAGDAVLLAPACASFDQFQNFEDRGNQFIAAVKGRL